jgi:LmbE family N-acetylglucosaminyl deacetylase
MTRKWQDVSDLNTLAMAFETNFFLKELTSSPVDPASLESILLVAPHQDDEVIGAGGTLLLANRASKHVLFATDGSSKTREAHDSLRRREAQEACKRLGAVIDELGISNATMNITAQHVQDFSRYISDRAPQILMLPWLFDYPAKHRVINHLFYLAAKTGALPKCEVWGYQVHNVLFPNVYVDITPVIDEKVDIMRLYQSQLNTYARYDHMIKGMAAWNMRFLPRELQAAKALYIETFFALPAREYIDLVERFYLRDLAAVYQDDRGLFKHMQALQKQLLQH